MRSRVPFVLVALLFGIPLFIGLGRTDLENDEAIYSYSADRMIALHDWLTPRAIYDGADNPFLEKPPLKTWIVTAGQLAGLPGDESGMRFFDPLFAFAAFAYVFVLGRRLAGSLCGFVAVLLLFTFEPLVFEHGVRSNNMEAALLLTYCGGVYHFFRWADSEDPESHRHAWMVAAYFAFGFLIKFVAALFLPVILLAAFVWQPHSADRIRVRAREWILPALAAAAVIAPWFVYQTVERGLLFWNEILGHQIVTRFTSALDPNHLRPWHYYVVQTWRVFFDAGAGIAVAVGVACLAWRALRNRPWLARLLLLWWIVPFVLISAGTSKLMHYTYPFLPPMALGAGLAAVTWFGWWNSQLARWNVPASRMSSMRNRPWLESLLVAAAAVLFAVACWTALRGPLLWTLFGVRVLRNATAIRPALMAAAILLATTSLRAVARAGAVALLLASLPVPQYFGELQHLTTWHRPLHAIRDCVLRQTAGRVGVYGPDWRVGGHSFFYYFHSLGPYRSTPSNRQDITALLFADGRQAPAILAKSDAWLWNDAGASAASWHALPAVDVGNYVVALPGPYGGCAVDAALAGGPAFHFDQR